MFIYLTRTVFNQFESYIRDYQEKPVGEQNNNIKKIFINYTRFKKYFE